MVPAKVASVSGSWVPPGSPLPLPVEERRFHGDGHPAHDSAKRDDAAYEENWSNTLLASTARATRKNTIRPHHGHLWTLDRNLSCR